MISLDFFIIGMVYIHMNLSYHWLIIPSSNDLMILHVAQEEDEEELLAESEDTLTSEEAVAGKGIEGQ